MQQSFDQKVSTDRINMLGTFADRTRGFANVNQDADVATGIENNSNETQANIRRLTEIYGSEKLNHMTATEFYRLYKHHTLSKLWNIPKLII